MYFRSTQVSLFLLFMGKIRGKNKPSLHCSQGYRHSVEQNVNFCNTARVKLDVL